MRKFLFLCLLVAPFCVPVVSFAAPLTPGYFVTTWDTGQPGASASNQIQFDLSCSVPTCTVYWEDTTNAANNGTTTVSTGSNFITFPTSGIYRVDISNNITTFTTPTDNHKIMTVEQWGSAVWSNTVSMFYLSDNVHIKATDVPDLSQVTNMSYMFAQGPTIDTSIANWDVSHVTNMSNLFFQNTTFNQSLSSWTTPGLTQMIGMFNGATAFNQPLSNFDVSHVNNFSSIFAGATSFNQPLNAWDTTHADSFSGTFQGATAFNQPLSNWVTSGVADMGYTFENATHFNQDVSSWNYGAVTYFYSFLEGTELSSAHEDALLQKWASSTMNSNLDTNIGLKSFSPSGEANRLLVQTTNIWVINYQVTVSYQPGVHATLIGDGRQIGLPGQSTASVEVVPDTDCTFMRWSDEDPLATSIGTIRSDTFATSSITVSAVIDCVVATSTSSTGETIPTHHTQTSTLLIPPLPTGTSTMSSLLPPLNFNPVTTTDPKALSDILVLLAQLVDTLKQLISLGRP